MNELNEEQYNQLPDFLKDTYKKDGDVYKNAAVMTLKGTLNSLDGKVKDFEKQIADSKAAEQERITQAQQEAYEKAKKENNIEDILKLERQKLDDEKRRMDESANQFNERMKKVAENQRKSIASSFASSLATDKGKMAFERLIEPFIEFDPMSGEETYLNQDGSASSLNREQFMAEIKKDALFASLLKADIHTQGGGNMNGSTTGSANGKKFNEYNSQELVQMRRENPEQYTRLRDEFYS